jgi:G:T-mismatch repair DNA endonuclease (very short patch repair protein)
MIMDRDDLIQHNIINERGMINPHFTRSLKQKESYAVDWYTQIVQNTNILNKNTTLKERIYFIIHQLIEQPMCFVCLKQTKLQYDKTIGAYRFSPFCSSKCAAIHRDEKICLQKRQQTNLQRFGVINPMHLEKIKQKQKNTLKNKYGCHSKQTHIPLHSISILNDRDKLKTLHHSQKLSLTTIAENLGVNDTTVGRYLHKHNLATIGGCRSKGEIQICDWLDSLGIRVINNTKNVIGKELDVFLPDYNFSIEFCGLFWHSDYHKRITKNYHLEKFTKCQNINIQLITLYEDEWRDKENIVKNSILHKLNILTTPNIYAQQTEIRPVTLSQKTTFLDKNHIQGSGSGSINYGLFEQKTNNIIAVITFINNKNGQYILNRYATNKPIVGGFSKLLHYFKDQHPDWKKIVTFADCRWSVGDLYKKTGFVLSKILPPDYYYVDTNNATRIHKFNFRRKYLKTKLCNFDPTLSETQNCKNHGIPRIWDCGKFRFELSNMNKNINTNNRIP